MSIKKKGKYEDLSKADLERKKLIAELKQSELLWWKKPAYLGIMIPSLIAVLAYIQLYRINWFDNEKKLLEIKKIELIQDIQKFEIEKERIQKMNEKLIEENRFLEDSLGIAVAYEQMMFDSMNEEVKIIQKEVKEAIDYLEDEKRKY